MQVEAFCEFAAVKFIAEDWKAAAGKMNADLVGTAGVEAAFNKKARAAFYGDFFENAEVCFRVLAAAGFRHFTPLSLLGFAGNAVHVKFDGEGLPHTLFVFHHGKVLLYKIVVLKNF